MVCKEFDGGSHRWSDDHTAFLRHKLHVPFSERSLQEVSSSTWGCSTMHFEISFSPVRVGALCRDADGLLPETAAPHDGSPERLPALTLARHMEYSDV